VLRDDGSGRELASAEGIAAWKRGLAALEAAGATLVELDLPELQGLRALNSTILAIEAALYHQAWLSTRLQDYGEFMRLRILGGFAYGPTDFIRAQQGLGLLRRRSEERLRQVDILSTPTMPGEALALGTPARLSFTAPFNALGWPAISIPVGATAEGLPLGMQLVAQPWDETTLLRTARAAELGAG
jgi:aspartyl-tRNA(Asn)/glutamyl-tRNA(Gln) amidotransferase subunit A